MNRAKGPDQRVKFYIVFWVIFWTLSENVLEASFGLHGKCSPQLRFWPGPRKGKGHVRRARKVKKWTRWSGPLARLIFNFNK